MSNVLVAESSLQAIADAIRSKNGTQNTYKPSEMADAIEAISGGGITPTGTKEISITANGTTIEDVTNYASVEIDVDVPSGGITPTGTKTITENGTYDVSAFASAEVGVYPPLDTVTITENGSYDVEDYQNAVVNVPAGTTPTGTKQISITANGTTTEDVTNYASAEITVDTTNSGKHISTGDLCISMGAANWESNKATCNVSSTNNNTRRSLFTKNGSTSVYWATGSSTTNLADFHLIPIPLGSTSVKITIDKTIQCAVREFIETNGTITDSIGTTGWEDITADTQKTVALNSGTQYLAVSFRANSSNSSFAYNTIPLKAVVDFE